MLQLSPEGTLCHQISPETKKLVLVLATSMPVTEIREKVIETAETVEAVETAEGGKDGKESEGKNPKNLIWVLCIYPITF